MGTVKYTGPVASFHCPTNAEIRSLKVHFSPKQLGEGDPSPENVREIVGWDGVKQYYSGKNVGHVVGYCATTLPNPHNNRIITNTYGTTLSTVDPERSVTITQSQAPETSNINSYKNGYMAIELDNLVFGATYDISFRVTNITSNPLNATLNNLGLGMPNGTRSGPSEIKGDILIYKNKTFAQRTGAYYVNQMDFDLRMCGMSFTLSDFMITPAGMNDGIYESYNGSIMDYEFGVLGKNKFDKNGLTPIDAYIDNSGNLISSTASKSFIIPVAPNTQYTISKVASTRFAIGQSSKNIPETGDILTNTIGNKTGTSISFTTTATTKSIVAWVYVITDTVSYNDIIDSIQLELGSTATTYEPYDPNHTVYGGWVDLITGEMCEEWKFEDLSTSNTTIKTTTKLQYPYHMRTVVNDWVHSTDNLLFNMIPNTQTNVAFNSATCGWQIPSASNIIYWVHPDCATEEGAESLRTNTDIKLIYKVSEANSSTYYLAPTQLQTFLGQNNVWSNADYVEVEYDLYETQDILARKQFIIANQPHIVKPVAASLQNFVTDMAAPLKECKIGFEPVQDLHGYSNPWPAGSGKNIAKPYDNSYISSTYVSFDYSASTGTFHCSGSASASSSHSSPSASNAINNNATFTLPAGTYTLSIIDGDGTYIYAQCVSSTETVLAETTSHVSFTTNEALTVFVRLKVAAGATVDNTVKIQLEAGSTATSYVPYENVCPISGWTRCEVYQRGKNLINLNDIENNKSIAQDGTIPLTYNFSITGFIPVKEVYYTLSATGGTDNANFRLHGYDESKNWVEQIDITLVHTGSAYEKTFKPSANIAYVRLSYITTATNLMVELGQVKTTYEPYSGTTIPITFPATKNLFDINRIEGTPNPTDISNATSPRVMDCTHYYRGLQAENYYYAPYTEASISNGVITIKNKNNNSYGISFPVAVVAGSTYTLSFNAQSSLISFGYYDNNWNYISHSSSYASSSSVTITIPNDVAYVVIVFRSEQNATYTYSNIQFELGNTATTYEPYGTIYGGYVDLVKGELVETWVGRIKKVSAYNVKYAGESHNAYAFNNFILNTDWNSRSRQLCTIAPFRFASNNGTTHFYIADNGRLNLYLSTDTDENTEFFAGAPLSIPIVHQLTPTQLKTLRGTNNIWSNANSDTEIAYWAH